MSDDTYIQFWTDFHQMLFVSSSVGLSFVWLIILAILVRYLYYLEGSIVHISQGSLTDKLTVICSAALLISCASGRLLDVVVELTSSAQAVQAWGRFVALIAAMAACYTLGQMHRKATLIWKARSG